MSSEFVNGDRSPIPPDKLPPNKEISTHSTSRLEQINKDGQLSLNYNQLHQEIRDSYTQQKPHGRFNNEGRGGQVPSLQSQRLTSTAQQSLGAHKLGLQAGKEVNYGDNQSAQENSLDLVLEKAKADTELRRDYQSLGDPNARNIQSNLNGGHVQQQMEVDFPPLTNGGQNQSSRNEDTFSGSQNWYNSLNQQNQTWSQIMSTGKNRYVLQKKNISKSNEKFFITRDVIERGSLEWKNVIVGFFFDASFGYRYVERILRNKWKLIGSLEINADKNFFYLTFSNEEDRKQVLDGGPFFINGKVFVLREWNHNIEVEKMSCKSIPIWARFWDIPKFLWNSEGLSTIASCIGNPLFADSNTMEKRRLGYARLCIEVDSSFEFPDKLQFESELLEFSIDVEYQWIPIKCRNCRCFGHHFHQCKMPTRREEEVQPASPNEQNGTDQEENSDGLKEKEASVAMNSRSAHTSVPIEIMENPMANLLDIETGKNSELLNEKITVEVDNIVDSGMLTEMNKEKNGTEQEEPLFNKNKGDMNKTSAEKQQQENYDKSEKRNNNVGSRKLQGRHEVVHIQKERDNRARTRSGDVLHTKNAYSSLTQNDDFARQFYEDFDEDGASEADEDGIPFVDGVPKVLKTYPTKANNQNKKPVATPIKEKVSKEIVPQNNRARRKFR